MKRNATAVWNGSGKEGTGHLTTQSTVLNETQYSFNSRFAEGVGTNPEELIAAAHAGWSSWLVGQPFVQSDLLADVYVRVCGARVGKATQSVQTNSNNVIGDHLWPWSADHGTSVGWTSNTAGNGSWSMARTWS